jgi:DNA-directed RNA polymerase subunit E'/Rpb7
MEDDFYIYDEVRNHLIGRRTRRMIRLGDNVEVQVAKVNTFKKQVDFFLASKPRETPKPKFNAKFPQIPASSRHRNSGHRHKRRR